MATTVATNDLKPEPAEAPADLVRARRRILTLSTIAFTLMFAVWLMFGVLGIPIREEFGLTDVELARITAVAVLNGAIWRLPAGIAAAHKDMKMSNVDQGRELALGKKSCCPLIL